MFSQLSLSICRSPCLSYSSTNKIQTYSICCVVVMNIAYRIFLFFLLSASAAPYRNFGSGWSPRNRSSRGPQHHNQSSLYPFRNYLYSRLDIGDQPDLYRSGFNTDFSRMCYMVGILALSRMFRISQPCAIYFIRQISPFGGILISGQLSLRLLRRRFDLFLICSRIGHAKNAEMSASNESCSTEGTPTVRENH